MSGADPIGEFVVGTALGLGLGKMVLSKMGQNAVSHWARNSLLNAGNLTKNVSPVITRKAWNTIKDAGNEATSYVFEQ